MKIPFSVLGLSGLLVVSPLIAEENNNAPVITPPIVAQAPLSPQIKAYRQSLKKYGRNLKGILKQAMQKGGPIAALEVCNIEALPMTVKHSDMYAWDISRTSLKPRNTANTADSWETKVMQGFEDRKAKGEKLNRLEHSETVVADDGTKTFRYMKAIPTAGLCLACHGSDMKAEVTAKIKTLYPDDKAIDFKIGDLRGAFSISEVIK